MTCKCVAKHAWAAATDGRCTLLDNGSGLCDACELTAKIGGDCALPYIPPEVHSEPPAIALKPGDVDAAIEKALDDVGI
jgi:hypothetical protein